MTTVETDLVFTKILSNVVVAFFLRELAVVGIVVLEVFLKDLRRIVRRRGRVIGASFRVFVIEVVLGGLFLVVLEFD